MINLADNRGLLKALGRATINHWVSLYANDVVVFLRPTEQDLMVIREILAFFEKALGLSTNHAKAKCCH